jgi:predicted nucleic acid-binding protein
VKVVIDASAIIAVALEEADDALIAATRRTLSDADQLAPAIMPVEVAGAIAMTEWTGRRSNADADAAWQLASDIIQTVDLRATTETVGLIGLCRSYRLRGADACYLQLSIDQAASLLTGDKALAMAAHAAGVALVYDPRS